MTRVVLVACYLCGLIASLSVGWLFGLLSGESSERHRRYIEEQELIVPVLATNPEFSEIHVIENTGPGGGIFLMGELKTHSAVRRFRNELIRLYGEQRGNRLWDEASITVLAGDR